MCDEATVEAAAGRAARAHLVTVQALSVAAHEAPFPRCRTPLTVSVPTGPAMLPRAVDEHLCLR